MAVLGPEPEWHAPPQAPAGAPRKAPVRQRPQPAPSRDTSPRALLAQQEVNRQAEIDALNSKILRSPVLARAEGLIPAADLGRIGLDTRTTNAGMAYGIDPNSITPQQLAMIDAMMARGGR